jgi:hypothetical protein
MYERERVFRDATVALGTSVEDVLQAMRRPAGSAWQARRKLAAAALTAARSGPLPAGSPRG